MTRHTALCIAALSALAPIGAAAAPRPEAAPQVEWAQDYAAPARMRTERSETPLLSGAALASTEKAVEAYAAIVARGGWRPLANVEGLKVGSRGPAVTELRHRLADGGDLEPAMSEGAVYDSFVREAVRRFQARHGLTANGVVGATTVTAMNVPAERRLAQLRINVERLRSYQVELGRRYVVVNLPAALVETVEDGSVYSLHAAGVGKIDRQSPIMNAKITEVNLNPYWHVPASIIRKDLIPKMQKDANYLTDNKIHAYSGDVEVSPASINWFSDEATRYRFRQEPGAKVNSMGFVRINIPNPDGVYMHDTPSKGVFGDDFRFVSSGCVRVQNVRGYVDWLLKETPGWDSARVGQAIETGERTDAKLAQPVPVYWTYVTAWSTPDGLVQFRDDIYGKDANSIAYQAQGGAPAAVPEPRQAVVPGRPAVSAAALPPRAEPVPAASMAPSRTPGVVFIPLAAPRTEPVVEADAAPRPPRGLRGGPEDAAVEAEPED